MKIERGDDECGCLVIKGGGGHLPPGGADVELKCENCGSCLKHPQEEELQSGPADG